MSSSSPSQALLEKVPEHWASMVRPFLQRSKEFEDKEPLVAYFLRTHVAFLCMKHRKKEDKAGTAFLMALLEALEKDKARLGAQLDGVDGRTALTRCALMLFARADDAERTGNASMTLVRIFYTSAVLFEATEQFTEDGKMDSIAAQKAKYAKYIATRMKKALDAKEPYVSPNKIEQVEGGPEAGDIGAQGAFTTAPASCFSRPTSNPDSAVKFGGGGGDVPPPPPMFNPAGPTALPPARTGGHDAMPPPPPAYSYDSNASSTDATPAPPFSPPQQPPSPAYRPANNNPTTTTASAPPLRFASAGTSSTASSTTNTMGSTPVLPAVVPPASQRQSSLGGNAPSGMNMGGGNFKPSVDQMIDAQKYASRAVSALQFYDYENAKKQLITAMQILNGLNS